MTMELFADLPLPDLSSLDVEDIKRAWPQSLADMFDIAVEALQQSGEPPERASQNAIAVITALSRYHGGRMFYLPIGDGLEKALRDNKIYREYKGTREDIYRIVRQENIAEQTVYRILKEQLALHRGKVQGKLVLE